MRLAIVVTGLPGSGKTTLALELARGLGMPLLCKDLIKESLWTGGSAVEESQRLGALAFQQMYAHAAPLDELVLETYFHPGRSEPELLSLDRAMVQVHCACPAEVARQRFFDRIARGDRHPVHHDRWDPSATSRLDLPGPCLEVDTTGPVDIALLLAEIRGCYGRAVQTRRWYGFPDRDSRSGAC